VLSTHAAYVPSANLAQFLEFDRSGAQDLLSQPPGPAQFLREVRPAIYFSLPRRLSGIGCGTKLPVQQNSVVEKQNSARI
jgi:hypothetical protein